MRVPDRFAPGLEAIALKIDQGAATVEQLMEFIEGLERSKNPN
jgi:hypothetical protein